jgi:hypothetical protein
MAQKAPILVTNTLELRMALAKLIKLEYAAYLF